MKKFVIILLALCLVLGCAVGYFFAKDGNPGSGEPVALHDPENVAPETAEEAAAPEADAPAGEEPITVRTLDFEAIRALHAPEEIAGRVGEREVSWDEYFYWLHDVGMQAEQYIQTLAAYGQQLDWSDKLSAESESTLAEYVAELAGSYAVQLNTIEALAAETGAELSAENEAALAERLQTAIESACGEGAGEEEFNALLEQEMISRRMYDRLERANYLYQNSFTALYGENGEKVSTEDALAFLRDGEYLCATHILFMTVDLDTGETLEEDAAAQKLQQAEAIVEELRAIEDVEARVKRFGELKQQYCEDTGKVNFPDGYLFTPGVMVSEFEDGVRALAEYEVSDPILSAYGYHVIMRLPLSAEMTMQYSEAGTPLDARAVYANEQFNALMNSRVEQSAFTPAEGFAIDLTEYLK